MSNEISVKVYGDFMGSDKFSGSGQDPGAKSCGHDNEASVSVRQEECFGQLNDCNLLKVDSAP
jgi:hypothetical protein